MSSGNPLLRFFPFWLSSIWISLCFGILSWMKKRSHCQVSKLRSYKSLKIWMKETNTTEIFWKVLTSCITARINTWFVDFAHFLVLKENVSTMDLFPCSYLQVPTSLSPSYFLFWSRDWKLPFLSDPTLKLSPQLFAWYQRSHFPEFIAFVILTF
jgi:hypothetical protein